MRKKSLMAIGLAIGMNLSLPLLSYANPTQSARWVGSGERWQVSDNQGGFIKDCWFQDDVTGHWYMLGAEDGSVMYSGLVTDKSTGKTYMLNTVHDGTFGRMLTKDGVYNVNGVDVYITFNQEHDGTFGAITSGLSEVRNAGVNERQLDKIPTDNGNTKQPENTTPPQKETQQENNKATGELRASDGTVIPQDFVDNCRELGYPEDLIRESWDQAGGKGYGDVHWE